MKTTLLVVLEDASTKSSGGMDCSMCVINKKSKEISFSGAYNNLVIINNGEVNEIKADRTPIGGRTNFDYNFSSHSVKLSPNECYYLFTDGYADQFGGPKGKKFMLKKLKALFAEIHTLPLEEQKNYLDKTLTNWMGNHDQVDDILILGFKI